MDNRIEWVDSLKGLGIILVVWGHMELPLLAESIIYSFHMPLFFFISGFLYKKNNLSYRRFVAKKGKSLLIPYFFFAILSLPFGAAIDIFIDKTGLSLKEMILNLFFLNGSVGWNSPIWFLVCLFLVEIAYYWIGKIGGTKRAIILLIIFGVGFALSYTGIRYPFGLQIIAWAILAFEFGRLTREKNLVNSLRGRFVLSLVTLIAGNLLFGLYLNTRISVYHNILGNYLLFYLAAVAGTLGVVVLMSKLPPNKVLAFLGRNTLLILATHYFFLYGYRLIDKVVFNSTVLDEPSYVISIITALVTLLAYVPLVFIFEKYLPFALGKFPKRNNDKLKVA